MLSELRGRDFRNLEPLGWRPAAGRQLLFGPNGAGKTSLLEAVYVVATTRSFRTARLARCRRHGAEGFALAGDFEGESRATLEVSWTSGGLERRFNGKEAALARHLEAAPVLAWSQRDVEVLAGVPQARRRLLDQLVVAARPASLGVLSRYRQSLQQKRAALQQGGGSPLTPWNELLAALAAELVALRGRFVASLNEALVEVLSTGALDLEGVELAYRPSPAAAEEGAAAAFEAFEEEAPRERDTGRPVVGPHRDEIEIRWRGKEVRHVASAGERKALGMALLAARTRVLERGGRRPLVLIDDADSELDPGRLGGVWSLFREEPQLIASSSRPEAFEGLATDARWRVEHGRLSR